MAWQPPSQKYTPTHLYLDLCLSKVIFAKMVVGLRGDTNLDVPPVKRV